jgi:hypothetical protein
MENCNKNINVNQNEKQNPRKERYWIAFSSNGWFKEITEKTEQVQKDQNWENHIYFDTLEELRVFEENLKRFIKVNYPRAKDEGWFPEIKV